MDLGKKIQIEVVAAQTIEADKVTLVFIVDDRNLKTVTAHIRVDGNEPFVIQKTLWKGDEYDIAGQWTDEDADKRLIEILTA